MVQPHMTAAAGQDWNGFVFGHPFFAMDAKIDLPLCGRVAIHPLNDAGLVGTGFGSDSLVIFECCNDPALVIVLTSRPVNQRVRLASAAKITVVTHGDPLSV